MEVRQIKQNDTDFKQGLGIVKNNLPKIQTLPDFVMRALLLNPNSKLFGIYNEEKQLGTAFISENSKMIYLMYLAILPECQGKGYGSAFFEWLIEYAKERSVVCNVEENNTSRIYNKGYVTKNGYTRTILGHKYNIYCRGEFDPAEYKKLAKSIYCGLTIVTIKRNNI